LLHKNHLKVIARTLSEVEGDEAISCKQCIQEIATPVTRALVGSRWHF